MLIPGGFGCEGDSRVAPLREYSEDDPGGTTASQRSLSENNGLPKETTFSLSRLFNSVELAELGVGVCSRTCTVVQTLPMRLLACSDGAFAEFRLHA